MPTFTNPYTDNLVKCHVDFHEKQLFEVSALIHDSNQIHMNGKAMLQNIFPDIFNGEVCLGVYFFSLDCHKDLELNCFCFSL